MKKHNIVIFILMLVVALGFLVYGFVTQEKKAVEIKEKLQQACLAAVDEMPLLDEELSETTVEDMLQNFVDIGVDHCVAVFWTDGFFVKTKGVVSELKPWIYANGESEVRFFLDTDYSEVVCADGLFLCGSREDICEGLAKEDNLNGLDFFESQESFKKIRKETIETETEKALQGVFNGSKLEMDWNSPFVMAFVPGQEKETLVAAKLQVKQVVE